MLSLVSGGGDSTVFFPSPPPAFSHQDISHPFHIPFTDNTNVNVQHNLETKGEETLVSSACPQYKKGK